MFSSRVDEPLPLQAVNGFVPKGWIRQDRTGHNRTGQDRIGELNGAE